MYTICVAFIARLALISRLTTSRRVASTLKSLQSGPRQETSLTENLNITIKPPCWQGSFPQEPRVSLVKWGGGGRETGRGGGVVKFSSPKRCYTNLAGVQDSSVSFASGYMDPHRCQIKSLQGGGLGGFYAKRRRNLLSQGRLSFQKWMFLFAHCWKLSPFTGEAML